MPRVDPDPDLASRLGAVDVMDTQGHRFALGDLWADRPVVLAHLRHFG